jgi:hypothetical protein
MISSLEVGATFRIQDLASAQLKEIAGQLRVVDEALAKVKGGLVELAESRFPGLTRSLGTLVQRMDQLGASAQTGAERVDKAFGSIDTAIGGTLSRVQQLKAELASLHAPALGGGGGGRWSGAARGHGGGGGPIGGGPRADLPGGYRLEGNSLLSQRLLAAFAYGVYEDVKVQDAIVRAMQTGQLPVHPGMENDQYFKTIRGTVQRISEKTGYGPMSVAEAVLGTERQFGAMPLSQRIALEEQLIPYAAYEARMKDTSLASAFRNDGRAGAYDRHIQAGRLAAPDAGLQLCFNADAEVARAV